MGEIPPPWLVEWCRRQLHATPVEILLRIEEMGTVFGVRLDDDRVVAVKARPDESGRAVTCVAVQRFAADAGVPCARPLTEAKVGDGTAVHAEAWRPGGAMLRGDDVATAERFAVLLADVMAITAPLRVTPPLPNPPWVRWQDERAGRWPVAGIENTARRVRARLTRSRLPCVIGHADWESQNVRWEGGRPYAIYDWDSLAWLPEAAVVGAASGAFASAETPTLAPLDSSAAFLAAYQDTRARAFTAEEIEVAWAASLWPALHNARGEVVHGSTPVASAALCEQAAARLACARA